MRDLLQQNFRQVRIRADAGVKRMKCIHGDRDDFLVNSGLVFHEQCTHRAAPYDGAGHNGYWSDDQHIARITILRQRLRNETVVSRIVHGGMQKAIHKHRTGGFIQFVFDRNSAYGNLNHRVQIERRVPASANLRNIHENSQYCTGSAADSDFLRRNRLDAQHHAVRGIPAGGLLRDNVDVAVGALLNVAGTNVHRDQQPLAPFRL